MTPVEFLEWFRPGGPWVLTAIVPDKGTSTITFTSENMEQMSRWIMSKDGFENVYFQVNPTGNRNIVKKTSKKDITAGEWLYVDVDPRGDKENFVAERKRILARLKEFSPPPSLIIDSGGGYQAFWRLSEPFSLSGSWEEYERYNKQLEVDLGGDHCHNVDRIMRLPGTINVPNKKKLSKGRVPTPTSVKSKSDQIFDIAAFNQAPLLDGGDSGDVGRHRVTLSGNLPRLKDVDDLDEWSVSNKVKLLIVQGHDPDDPSKYGSRSECFWHVICELVRSEVPDDVIGSVILDEGFLISGHVLDQKNPQGYATRQLQRAHEYGVNPELPGFNDDHFVTFVGGKCRVVKEQVMNRDRELIYMSPGDFKAYYSNRLVSIGTDMKSGLPITAKLGDWWFSHEKRRSYLGLVFDPSEQTPPDFYNLWRGFAFQAKEGTNHERFLEHLFENVCGGVQEYYDYLIGWSARLVQTPATQSETAVVMRGREGTGKNTFAGTLGSLIPEHFFEATSVKQVAGNFNSHLRDKILVHANEAFFAGDPKIAATLKGMITDPTIAIEAKGVDIQMQPNYTHIIMSSNEDWVVPAGPDARRYFVLDVSTKRMQDDDYFGKLRRDLDDEGRSHLLRFLLSYDLSKFNVRRLPITEALGEQKLRSMPKEVAWLMSRLEEGRIGNKDWTEPVSKRAVYDDYIAAMKDIGEQRRMAQNQFGKFIHTELEPKTIDAFVGGHRYAYNLPPLDVVRARFDERHGGPYEWPEITEQGEIPF